MTHIMSISIHCEMRWEKFIALNFGTTKNTHVLPISHLEADNYYVSSQEVEKAKEDWRISEKSISEVKKKV